MILKTIGKLACASALLVASIEIASAADRITLAGSTTVKPIVDEAVKQFKPKHPGVEFVVGMGGSGRGIELVGNGSVNIGTASRPLDEGEKTQWHDLVTHRIGVDGVALVTNVANPVANLTKEQVRNIYTGTITNWKELGGPNARIVLCTLNHNHGTSDVFLNYFGLEAMESGAGPFMTATHRKKGDVAFAEVTAMVIEDHRQVLAKIMTHPNALGYVSIGQAMQVSSSGGRIRLLALDGIAPAIANVVSGVYPFSRPLLVITKGEAMGSVRDFVDFLSGPVGQAIITKFDYISAAEK
jgi:phosphate transport system substrate-binding protein